MDNYQFIRYQRIFIEEFFLLEWIIREKEFFFAISGSTYNIYNIIVDKESKTISCSCRDFQDNCQDKFIICKHCCFILFIVTKLFRKYKPNIRINRPNSYNSDIIRINRPNGYNSDIIRINRPNGYNIINDSNFFINLVFTNVEILILEKKIKYLSSKTHNFIKKNFTDRYRYLMLIQEQKKIFYKYFIKEKIPLNTEVTCGVCLKNIHDNSDLKYLSCPDCKKFIHEICVKKWLAKKVNCVYCRSEIWETYWSLENQKQINLFE